MLCCGVFECVFNCCDGHFLLTCRLAEANKMNFDKSYSANSWKMLTLFQIKNFTKYSEAQSPDATKFGCKISDSFNINIRKLQGVNLLENLEELLSIILSYSNNYPDFVSPVFDGDPQNRVS